MAGYVGWVNELLDAYKSKMKQAEQFDKMKGKLDPAVYDFMGFMVNMFITGKDSIKFKLPLDAKLFDFPDNKLIAQSLSEMVGDELKLPFPEIALEFLTTTPDGEVPMIVLAREVEEHISLIIALKVEGAWRAIESVEMMISRFDDFAPEYHYMDFHGHDMNKEEIERSSREYLKLAYVAVSQFLCALACSNVKIADHGVNPSPLKQRMRKEKKKLPLYTYKVLTVKVGKKDSDVIRLDANDNEDHTESQPGTKRSHLRRGHPRVYKSGLKIWVNPCTVSNKKLGEVDKSYNITN